MESEESKRPTEKMGITMPPMSADQPSLGPGVEGEESRWWDVYNNEAKKVDNELIKDWREKLNGLLLFAAIFAAVLTAFIIESKKLLEEDQATVLVDVMVFFTNNQANETRAPYVKPDFHPTKEAISINCLLFASLCSSLIAAFASVIALQWVADYDAATTQGGSEHALDKAKLRQFRFAGVVRWRMSEIIDTLPFLIFVGVVLFFAGLVEWIAEINHTVGLVVDGGAAVVAGFYFLSTAVAVISAAAPFRTAPARWIHALLHRLRVLIFRMLQTISPKFASEWIETRNCMPRRDDRAVKANAHVERDAYLWVAGQPSLSFGRWIPLLIELPQWAMIDRSFRRHFEVPWRLLTTMALHYYNNSDILQYTVEDSQNVTALVLIASTEAIRREITPEESAMYERGPSTSENWNRSYSTEAGSAKYGHPLFLLTRDLPLPSLRSASEMKMTIELSKWRNSAYGKPEIWQNILNHADAYSTRFLHSAFHMLYNYIPGSGWRFGDKKNQTVYASLFKAILERAMMGQLSFESSTLLIRAFSHLASGTHFYDRRLLYGQKIILLPPDIKALHSSAALLFARSLSSCPKGQLSQALETLTDMLWLIPDESLKEDLSTPTRWENRLSRDWPKRIGLVPGALEILEGMIDAQRRCDRVGTLWYADHGCIELYISIFQVFNGLVASACTAAQYFSAIETLRQGFEVDGMDFHFDGPISEEHHQTLSKLDDPCVRFIAGWFLKISLPGLETGTRQEFLEDTEALLAESLSRRKPALARAVWAFFWVKLSHDQKKRWFREARTNSDYIVCLEHMSGGPILHDPQYDTPANLWRCLLEADLSVGWGGPLSIDLVTVNDCRDLFRGVNLRDRRILGLIACLFYSRNDASPELDFSPGVDLKYIQYAWKMCEDIKARPSHLLNNLIELLPKLRGRQRRFECAIILKLFQDSLDNLWSLSVHQLDSLTNALGDAVKLSHENWLADDVGSCMVRQAMYIISQLHNQAPQATRAVVWPRDSYCNHPVACWRMVDV